MKQEKKEMNCFLLEAFLIYLTPSNERTDKRECQKEEYEREEIIKKEIERKKNDKELNEEKGRKRIGLCELNDFMCAFLLARISKEYIITI